MHFPSLCASLRTVALHPSALPELKRAARDRLGIVLVVQRARSPNAEKGRACCRLAARRLLRLQTSDEHFRNLRRRRCASIAADCVVADGRTRLIPRSPRSPSRAAGWA